jgi:bifunctional isochorismate lyase/aryl carrier protein
MKLGLPAIAAYALPEGDEIPAARVPWRIERARAALLIHDMQNYFVNAFAGHEPIGTVIANIAALRQHCDAVGVPVFYTAQPGAQDRRDRGLQADFWGPGMPATDGQPAIVDALSPGAAHIVLTKWRYSAFARTTLEPMLRARGRDQLIVCGVFAHIGCLMTTADAFMRDVEPFFVADGVADFSRAQHDLALTYAAGRCAVPTTTAALLQAL